MGLLLLVAALASAQETPPPPDLKASVVSVRGSASVKAGQKLGAGDVVRTGEDGRVQVLLGASSILELQPGAELRLDSLSPQGPAFGLSGGVVAKLQKSAGGAALTFRTASAVVRARLGELVLSQAASDQPTDIAVFSGEPVEVSELHSEPVSKVGPGQETSVSLGWPTPDVGAIRKLSSLGARLDAIDRASLKAAAAPATRSTAARPPTSKAPSSDADRKRELGDLEAQEKLELDSIAGREKSQSEALENKRRNDQASVTDKKALSKLEAQAKRDKQARKQGFQAERQSLKAKYKRLRQDVQDKYKNTPR